jgi:hypothetical protein
MDLSQFFAEVKRRNIRKLAVAYVTAGLLLIELAAVLLAIFEAAASTKPRHTSMASVHWHHHEGDDHRNPLNE